MTPAAGRITAWTVAVDGWLAGVAGVLVGAAKTSLSIVGVGAAFITVAVVLAVWLMRDSSRRGPERARVRLRRRRRSSD
jgi:high-affinity Fe2+/Pb2+ permease